jgi:hypothetical protein
MATTSAPDFDPPLTPAEQAFRELIARPKEYAKWAADTRRAWAATPAGILAARKAGKAA